jgi:hypothetical protein
LRQRTTYRARWGAANPTGDAAIVGAFAAGVVACSDASVATRGARYDIGQWIWSARDSALLVDASRTIDSVVPTVWIGSVGASRNGSSRVRLALSPRVAGASRVAAVIRFDDDFTRLWENQSDSVIAATAGSAVKAILSVALSSGVTISEVQLDYDCPERLLPRWAAVVRSLSRDALAGRAVWLTSLVAHVRHREYGDLFRDNIAGHIVQVFDTGDRMSVPYARQLERLLTRHRLPFRLGVGAFERQLANGATTHHREWFGAARVMAGSEWFRGVWVFPGGSSWASLLERVP